MLIYVCNKWPVDNFNSVSKLQKSLFNMIQYKGTLRRLSGAAEGDSTGRHTQLGILTGSEIRSNNVDVATISIGSCGIASSIHFFSLSISYSIKVAPFLSVIQQFKCTVSYEVKGSASIDLVLMNESFWRKI